MKNRDLAGSIFWMAVGGFFVIGALQQGLIRKDVPGPGFLPFFSGAALILISLLVFVPALRGKAEAKTGAFFPERDSLRKVGLALVALFAYVFALDYAGYVLTTFVFMYFTAQLMESKGRRTSLVVAVLAAALSYMLFVVFLDVQLPAGPLGF